MPAPSFAGLLLDIEGTTSSISFVYDEMFPFVRRELDGWLRGTDDATLREIADQYAADAGAESVDAWQSQVGTNLPTALRGETVRLMDADVKATGLKLLQGKIWESGFASGELKAHLYDDVVPTLERCRGRNIPVRIYSSGSVAAQLLFFGHTTAGDLRPFLAGHDDTTTGPKKEAASYAAIVEKFGLPASEILFVSDVAAELDAARTAGLQTRLSVRPGNPPQPEGHEAVTSFDALWA